MDLEKIYNWIKEKADNFQKEDYDYIKNNTPLDEQKDEFENLEEEYQCYSNKLKTIFNIKEEDKVRFIELVAGVENIETINRRQKFQILIGLPDLITSNKTIITREDKEVYFLAAATFFSENVDQKFYLAILSNPAVSSLIVSQSSDLETQLDLSFDIQDALADDEETFLAGGDPEQSVRKAIEIVLSYNKENDNEKNKAL